MNGNLVSTSITHQPPNRNDPLAQCPCGYSIYSDDTFMVNGMLIGRIIVYRCAGVVRVDGDGKITRKTSCFQPLDPNRAVTL